MKIKTISIVGANGTMGRNVAAIFASFGNAQVYMISRSIEKSQKAIQDAVKSVKADSINSKMQPADYSMLEACISKSDLVFESVSEDLNIKSKILVEISQYLSPTAICCTGTSGLSITILANLLGTEHRKRFLGVHFFNPPYNLTLCELIPTKYTDSILLKELTSYLTTTLIRTVVPVKDMPAFLGNRIGFQSINRCLQLAEEYKAEGGIDYIDTILGPFTGRAMAPLVTANFVGLDVHKAIVDNIYKNTDDYAHDTFKLPNYLQNLIDNGFLGKKTNCGLYKTEIDGERKKTIFVYDIENNTYRPTINYRFKFIDEIIASLKIGDYKIAFDILKKNTSLEAKRCLSFLLEYILYALQLGISVGNDISSADDVMATGFNWCPPQALIEVLGGKEEFLSLVQREVSSSILKEIDLELLLSTINSSKYDYRKFIRAKH